MVKPANTHNPIRLRRTLSVGALDAETDADFLSECFIESEDYERLCDCSDPHSIILGRTGAGKSAAILRIANTNSNTITLDPNSFSFQYIENSNIIRVVEELGVNLDLFYRLLWRHVITVELLKCRYNIIDAPSQSRALQRLEQILSPNKVKTKAIEYVRDWGDKFWDETEVRVKELTKKVEDQLEAGLKGGDHFSISSVMGGKHAMSTEEKQEIKNRASKVINEIQIKKLSHLIDALADEVFSDNQKKFYILIDKLDDNWASTDTRCRLIRALIEEIKVFRKLKTVKIIVGLRRDLLAQVFDKTRDSGFQEEKYEAYMLPLRWDKKDLSEIIDKRIRVLFERKYTGQRVGFNDIFPTTRGDETSLDFIITRTLRRPRDVIQFVNECFKLCEDGQSRITWRILRAAEAVYSEKRLKSLYEEWSNVYPALETTLRLLRGKNMSFKKTDLLSENTFPNIIQALYEGSENDPCVRKVKSFFDNNSATENDIIVTVLECLYKIGAVGIKVNSMETFSWAYLDQPTISPGEVDRSTHFRVHRMLWRGLDIVGNNPTSLTDDIDLS